MQEGFGLSTVELTRANPTTDQQPTTTRAAPESRGGSSETMPPGNRLSRRLSQIKFAHRAWPEPGGQHGR